MRGSLFPRHHAATAVVAVEVVRFAGYRRASLLMIYRRTVAGDAYVHARRRDVRVVNIVEKKKNK